MTTQALTDEQLVHRLNATGFAIYLAAKEGIMPLPQDVDYHQELTNELTDRNGDNPMITLLHDPPEVCEVMLTHRREAAYTDTVQMLSWHDATALTRVTVQLDMGIPVSGDAIALIKEAAL